MRTSVVAAAVGAAVAQLLTLGIPSRAAWAWANSPPKCKLPEGATWTFDGATTVTAGTMANVMCSAGNASVATVSCPASTGMSGDTPWWSTCGHGGSCMNDEVIGAMVTCSGDTTTTTTTTTTMSGSSTTGASVGAAHGYGASACFASLALLAVGMAPPELGTLFYVEEAKYKAEKALIAAKFTGSALQTKKFDPQKDAKKPDFLAKNPTGKVPYLETEKGCIFTSNAVARYVARSRGDLGLYGDSFDEEGSVDTWLDFCLHEVEVPLMAWVYPVLGMMEEVPSATKDAQEKT
ncbi:unnamed protein product [Effrenium voratum]|nr:unnamed protein product [Effrenium voratum]